MLGTSSPSLPNTVGSIMQLYNYNVLLYCLITQAILGILERRRSCPLPIRLLELENLHITLPLPSSMLIFLDPGSAPDIVS